MKCALSTLCYTFLTMIEYRTETDTSSITLTVLAIAITTLACILLIPPWSGLPVFANGELLYIESLGIIFASMTLLLIASHIVIKSVAPYVRGNAFKRHALIYASTGLVTFLMMFTILAVWIRFDVKVLCRDATSLYDSDCIVALMNLAQDKTRDFASRNHAIWALGQLGDERSSSVLQSMYTGNIPSREPLERTVSQYELRKAITLTSGGSNPLSLLWRHRIHNSIR